MFGLTTRVLHPYLICILTVYHLDLMHPRFSSQRPNYIPKWVKPPSLWISYFGAIQGLPRSIVPHCGPGENRTPICAVQMRYSAIKLQALPLHTIQTFYFVKSGGGSGTRTHKPLRTTCFQDKLLIQPDSLQIYSI